MCLVYMCHSSRSCQQCIYFLQLCQFPKVHRKLWVTGSLLKGPSWDETSDGVCEWVLFSLCSLSACLVTSVQWGVSPFPPPPPCSALALCQERSGCGQCPPPPVWDVSRLTWEQRRPSLSWIKGACCWVPALITWWGITNLKEQFPPQKNHHLVCIVTYPSRFWCKVPSFGDNGDRCLPSLNTMALCFKK